MLNAGHCVILLSVNVESYKTVEVVAAIILDGAGRVLALKCAESKFDGGWEFPGGKIEPGESAQQALGREIAEELGLQIRVDQHIYTVERDYPAFHLRLHCFACFIEGGELQLREHTDSRWLSADFLNSVRWLPADEDVLPYVAELLK